MEKILKFDKRRAFKKEVGPGKKSKINTIAYAQENKRVQCSGSKRDSQHNCQPLEFPIFFCDDFLPF